MSKREVDVERVQSGRTLTEQNREHTLLMSRVFSFCCQFANLYLATLTKHTKPKKKMGGKSWANDRQIPRTRTRRHWRLENTPELYRQVTQVPNCQGFDEGDLPSLPQVNLTDKGIFEVYDLATPIQDLEPARFKELIKSFKIPAPQLKVSVSPSSTSEWNPTGLSSSSYDTLTAV